MRHAREHAIMTGNKILSWNLLICNTKFRLCLSSNMTPNTHNILPAISFLYCTAIQFPRQAKKFIKEIYSQPSLVYISRTAFEIRTIFGSIASSAD